jgi:hypothetical protein
LAHQNQIALNPPEIEIAIQPADNYGEIDIRCDDLFGNSLARNAPGELCTPWQDGFDPCKDRIHAPRGNPIPDRGQGIRPTQPACWRGLTFGGLRQDSILFMRGE